MSALRCFKIELWASLRSKLAGMNRHGNYGGFIGPGLLLRKLAGTRESLPESSGFSMATTTQPDPVAAHLSFPSSSLHVWGSRQHVTLCELRLPDVYRSQRTQSRGVEELIARGENAGSPRRGQHRSVFSHSFLHGWLKAWFIHRACIAEWHATWYILPWLVVKQRPVLFSCFPISCPLASLLLSCDVNNHQPIIPASGAVP